MSHDQVIGYRIFHQKGLSGCLNLVDCYEDNRREGWARANLNQIVSFDLNFEISGSALFPYELKREVPPGQ